MDRGPVAADDQCGPFTDEYSTRGLEHAVA